MFVISNLFKPSLQHCNRISDSCATRCELLCRDWFTSAHQLMKSGDRSEYRALPSQLKSLLSQLEPHDLCDFPNAHIVRVYLQPLEFLQLQRQFCPKFAFHSFLSADDGADAPTA